MEGGFLTNIYLWIGLALFFMLMFGFCIIFIVIIGKKTHAIIEFKAWFKGWPIALFFQDTKYCEWKPVKPDGGIFIDKEYGAFIISSTYVDRTTKNILIPFQADFAGSVDVKAAKLADDLEYVIKDNVQMRALREAIAKNTIGANETVDVLKTSINFGAIKNMMNAMIPHGVNSKIEKVIASRMKQYGNVSVPQVALMFAAILGAILMGYMIIKTTGAK